MCAPCQPRARTGRKPETLSCSQKLSKPALTSNPLRETTSYDGYLEMDFPGVIGAGQEQDVVRFAVSSAFIAQEVFDEAGELGLAAAARAATGRLATGLPV